MTASVSEFSQNHVATIALHSRRTTSTPATKPFLIMFSFRQQKYFYCHRGVPEQKAKEEPKPRTDVKNWR